MNTNEHEFVSIGVHSWLLVAKIGVIARLSLRKYRGHVTSARIILDPGSHAKEVGVEDPAEETFAARILYILTTSGAGSQTGPGFSQKA